MKSATLITSLAATTTICAIATRQTTEYRHAMREFSESHTNCEHVVQGCPWTNGVRIVPHHKVSVWQAPWLAADTNNFIMLCDPAKDRKHGCHLICGHAGNWKREGKWSECVNIRVQQER